MLTIKKNWFYSFFIVSLLVTEFFYINVGNGIAHIYSFFAVLVVLLLAGSVVRLLHSKVFITLIAFAIVNVFACALSDNATGALASFTSLLANLAISIAVAAILIRGKLSPRDLLRIIAVVTVISVLFGLLQILAFRAGIVLALSPSQRSQILIGFGPGFRTEANTFGKYMVLPFLLFLPLYLRNSKRKRTHALFAVIIVGILMNFTRTAIFGLCAGIIFALGWYALRGKLALVSGQTIKVAAIVAVSIGLIISGVVHVSDYAEYKIDSIINGHELLTGESAEYRLAAMRAVVIVTESDQRKFVIGNGWGQTYVEVEGHLVQAGGADLVNIFGFGGVLGVVLYLLYMGFAFHVLARVARKCEDRDTRLFAEGLLFAFVGMFVTGQTSGYLITPEYWMLIGICIYIDIIGRRARQMAVAAA